jgi:hypothetical protein
MLTKKLESANDFDLVCMDDDEMLEEVVKLRNAIRDHQNKKLDSLEEDRELYKVLPEKND